ncbi:histone H1-II-1-like protein [Reticulomyxa filosa]|uniref:Histone H1-II-1-like protein n=1 Tax=Reticulomyxa filosa TaxID=46433 RepID=X6M6T9_RETFI|nr:histone H1-II-1-like protein [Reticulomyxa filosa]|eukprot:ETO09708.1 histone H1-II-1-like protein [Reticulomyxa filosa]
MSSTFISSQAFTQTISIVQVWYSIIYFLFNFLNSKKTPLLCLFNEQIIQKKSTVTQKNWCVVPFFFCSNRKSYTQLTMPEQKNETKEKRDNKQKAEYRRMIVESMFELDSNHEGVTREQIKKYITSNYKIDDPLLAQKVIFILNDGISKGIIFQLTPVKYKLNPDASVKRPKPQKKKVEQKKPTVSTPSKRLSALNRTAKKAKPTKNQFSKKKKNTKLNKKSKVRMTRK